jgi:flagellar hook-associated protein 1 FlgK
MGLNATLATARNSLDVFSAGVQLAGQNIANASTPGYIREVLHLEPGLSYQSGSLILGTGVTATGVRQQIDQYLEQRIHSANGETSTATLKNTLYKQLEGELQELGESDLSTALTDFFDAIQNLASQPESVGFRDLAVNEGRDLARDIRSLHERIESLRQSRSEHVAQLVTEANDLIEKIQILNGQIVNLESAGLGGSDAGAARSERYQALARLSEILPIQYRELPTGAVDVFCDSDYLVLSGSIQKLQNVNTATGEESLRIELSKTGHDISRAGGELRGLIEGGEEVFGNFLGQLDELATSLIYQFNQVHSAGEGLKSFTSLLSSNRVLDSSLPLNQADNGLDFLPKHGGFTVQVINQETGLRESTSIAVDLDGIGTDASLEDIRSALDAVANLSATITPRGELQITSDAGYEFRFAEDSSGFLAALGINTFFSGSSAADIDVSSLVLGDSDYLASGQGGGPADGRNVTRLTELFETAIAGLNGKSLHAFYEQSISDVAQNSAATEALATGFATFRDSLVSQQQQFTGVSLDEEAIKVLELQRGYQAAARIVSTVNDLFNVLLNL